MTGVSLSRWTMAYFATALLALLTGQLLLAVGFGHPGAPVEAPQTLVVMHLLAIGWLSVLLSGALFQFVPVLVARPLHDDILPLPALLLLLAGLVLLLAGFLQMAGILPAAHSCFPYAATVLLLGFGLVLYDLGRTLWAARPLPLAARFVAVALACLLVTILLGALFSFTFAGLVRSEALLTLAASGLPLHVTAGLAGWLTFAAMGVSYRLLAMFMLAPELQGRRSQAVLWLGAGALAVALLGGAALLLANAAIVPAFVLAGVVGLAALGLYGTDVVHLYRKRKRPIVELNSQMAIPAFVSLAAAALLALASAVTGQFEDRVPTVVFLVIFGWLSGLGLAKLYKIVAFVTWLECFGPLLGKVPTPRVQDLVVERQARGWFVLYYLTVWLATLALAIGQTLAFRAVMAGMLVATLGIIVQLVRTRRLLNLPATSPSRSLRPRLLVVTVAPDRQEHLVTDDRVDPGPAISVRHLRSSHHD
jgi:hypothetical protein